MAAPRVVLRAPAAADQEEFLALVRASRRFHGGWAHPPHSAQKFRAYLERNHGDDYEAFLVCAADDGRIVGAVNLSQVFRGAFQNAFVGYWVGAPHARRGYGTEAVRLALRHAFRALRLHRVEANVQPDNAASLALLRRLGFRREGFSPRYLKVGGRWRDHERWAITREDWEG